MSNSSEFYTGTLAAQQQMLRERLESFLETLHPALRADVALAFAAEGKILSQPVQTGTGKPAPLAGKWALLTLLVAQSLSPEIDLLFASAVALAVESFVISTDLLDDVMDEDTTPLIQRIGVARTLNVALTLIALAQRMLLSLVEAGQSSQTALRLFHALQEATLTATGGQHEDLLAEHHSLLDYSSERCIAIAAAKAGALLRLACRMGALCAKADNILVESFSTLGELLGIAGQLDNDAHDLSFLLQNTPPDDFSNGAGASATTRKSDLIRGKKTLPIVLAAASLSKAGKSTGDFFDSALQKVSPLADSESEEYRQALHEGILATWGIALLYRERARDRLQDIEAEQPVSPALRLVLGLADTNE